MTVDEVMQYRRAEPFRPFVLELSDGREFLVREPEFVGRDESLMRLFVDAGDESIAQIPASSVSRVRLAQLNDQASGKGS